MGGFGNEGEFGGLGPTPSRRETTADPSGEQARRLRIHRVKTFEADSGVDLELALATFFEPGPNPDGTVRREQREALYPPQVFREGGTWYAVVFFTE